MRERHTHEIELPVGREDHRARPDEDQRERRHELRDRRLPQIVHVPSSVPSTVPDRARRDGEGLAGGVARAY